MLIGGIAGRHWASSTFHTRLVALVAEMAGLYSKDYGRGRGSTVDAGEELKGVDVVWTEVYWWDYFVL